MLRRWLMPFMVLLLIPVLIIGVFAASACAPKAESVSAADFYTKNTVTLVSPYGAGGGADLDARMFAAYWPETTGGLPIVSENRVAGGGIEGANYVYSAKPDGLILGHGGPSTAIYVPWLWEDPAVKFDITKFTWLGALNPTVFILLSFIRLTKGVVFLQSQWLSYKHQATVLR